MKEHDLKVVNLPLDRVQQHPSNVNNGDADALEESILINGFYSPIIVQKSTGYIIAGNHRYSVLLKMAGNPIKYGSGVRGAEPNTIPAIVLDVSDEDAMRMMLADNRITRLGHDDEGLLLGLLKELEQSEPALLGTGYTDIDLQNLLAMDDVPLDLTEYPIEDMGSEDKWDVDPVVDEDGECRQISISHAGGLTLTATDLNDILRALKMKALTGDQIDEAGVPAWYRRR